jgi:TPR repeat protein
MYLRGDGVPQGYKTAMRWYILAARQIFAEARYILGAMYLAGKGVLQNNVYAHMWFNIAASNGYKERMILLNCL